MQRGRSVRILAQDLKMQLAFSIFILCAVAVPVVSLPAWGVPQPDPMKTPASMSVNVTVTKNWAFQPTNEFGDTYTHMSTVAVAGNSTLIVVACQAAKVIFY